MGTDGDLHDVHGQTKELVRPGKGIKYALKIFKCVDYNDVIVCILQHTMDM